MHVGQNPSCLLQKLLLLWSTHLYNCRVRQGIAISSVLPWRGDWHRYRCTRFSPGADVKL